MFTIDYKTPPPVRSPTVAWRTTRIVDTDMAKETKITTLDQLPRGRRARVRNLAIRGTERRRLMDLGFLPGTSVEVELENPLGDPRAFRVMSGVVAIRREQARQIEITLLEKQAV